MICEVASRHGKWNARTIQNLSKVATKGFSPFALWLSKISIVDIICIGSNRNHEQPLFTTT